MFLLQESGGHLLLESGLGALLLEILQVIIERRSINNRVGTRGTS